MEEVAVGTWREGWWSEGERWVVAGIVVVMLGVIGWRYWSRPVFVADPLPEVGARAGEVVSTIDPNDAKWEEIALLSGMGEKKAKTIVAYREAFVAEHPGEIAFKSVDDLANVPGIGEATVQNLAPYLTIRVRE